MANAESPKLHSVVLVEDGDYSQQARDIHLSIHNKIELEKGEVGGVVELLDLNNQEKERKENNG